MREALGLGEPTYIRFGKWLWQFFVIEPLHLFDIIFGTSFAEGQQRVISWQTRSPVMDIVAQRIPQTLWVVGVAYLVAILIALPVGIYSAYRQYSWFDQAGTLGHDDRLLGAALLLGRSGHRDLLGRTGLVPVDL
jgi:peptide/nickel transport system permease protein